MGGVSTQPGRQSPFTSEEQKIFECYAKVRAIRGGHDPAVHEKLIEAALLENQDEWLLALEVYEISKHRTISAALAQKAFDLLLGYQKSHDSDQAELVAKGINIAAIAD